MTSTAVASVRTAIVACLLRGDDLPPRITPTHFLASALTDLAAFALLAGAPWHCAGLPDFHKRLMPLANMPPLIAAVARHAGTEPTSAGAQALFVVDTVRIVCCIKGTRVRHP